MTVDWRQRPKELSFIILTLITQRNYQCIILHVADVPKVEFKTDQKNANINIPLLPLGPRYDKVKGEPDLVFNACLCRDGTMQVDILVQSPGTQQVSFSFIFFSLYHFSTKINQQHCTLHRSKKTVLIATNYVMSRLSLCMCVCKNVFDIECKITSKLSIPQ